MNLADFLPQLSKTTPMSEQLVAALRERDEPLQREAVRALTLDCLRPDLVVDHYGYLLPGVRETLLPMRDVLLATARNKVAPGGEPRRLWAFQLLGDLGDTADAPWLARGFADPMPEVVAVACRGLLQRLRAFAAVRPATAGAAEALIDQPLGQDEPWRCLAEALSLCPVRHAADLCEHMLDAGVVLLPFLFRMLVHLPDSALARAFLSSLRHGAGERAGAIAMAMVLAANPTIAARGEDILAARRDRAFGRGVGKALALLQADRAVAAVVRASRQPWWSAVATGAHDLEPRTAERVLFLLGTSSLEPATKQACAEVFLAHAHEAVQAAAVAVLRQVRCVGGWQAVGRLLADNRVGLGQQAAARLACDAAPPERARLLAPLLGSADPELRRLAVRAVSPASFSRLVERFDGMDEKTREIAAKAVAKIDDQMLDRLTEEIGALDASRRLVALQIIGLLGAEQELHQPLTSLLEDPDRCVRATAIRIVELGGSIEGVKILLAALADPDRRIRANAIEAFEEIADPRFVQLLTPFLRDRDNRVRANAAKALWGLGWAGARDALLDLLEDADEKMRESAVWAIHAVRMPGWRDALAARERVELSSRVRAKIRKLLREPTKTPCAGDGSPSATP